MPERPIELEGVVKTFGGVRALDGVTLSVPPGSIYGFLGPNGSGKTTTIRCLTGLARPTSGRVSVFGRRPFPAPPELLARIGYLPDVPRFYEWMSGAEFLRFAGTLFGLERRVLDERVDALLELSGLRGVSARIGGYSRGMKQRLGVAQALVNAPDLLLLDEPTSALDPLGRKEILDMIAGMRGRATVFFSTHILADVERTCDTVAILDRGTVVAEAPIDELRRRAGRHRVVVGVDDPARLATAVRDREWSTAVETEGALVRIAVNDLAAAQRELPAVIAGLGLALHRLDADEISLEEVFVDLVGGRS